MAARTINVLSLCSGTGALDAGLRLALPEARTVCYVENEIAAAAILEKGIKASWLDDAPIWSDVRTFNPKPWRGLIQAVIGGYPCQPFSNAGGRQGHGVSDARHLWPYFEPLIADLKPEFCFFENVEAHLSYGYFDVVRPALERAGYAVTEGLYSAAEVGAPHERKRLYILAYARKQRLARAEYFSIAKKREIYKASQNPYFTRRTRWPAEPDTDRVDDGSAYARDRIYAVGNAVVPTVAAKAFCHLAFQLLGFYL